MSVPALSIGDFPAFFEAVHGHPPFPWQSRLLGHVMEHGWPRVLDLPTGSGKTASIDVAVFALALGADSPSRAMPLRIVYVVDRRTIVDQAYVRAERLRSRLNMGETDVVRRVGDRLASLSASQLPLVTAQLRGGIARDDVWTHAVNQAVVAVSTVDQVGSRLLFRGYGVSPKMRSIHAGLLGCDVVYLLDEVHLSQPFAETLREIRGRYSQWADLRPAAGPLVVVEMSATPGPRSEETQGDGPEAPFRLNAADLSNPDLARRLHASKPVALELVAGRDFEGAVERHVRSFVTAAGATVAVVVNRVAAARRVHQRLRALGEAADVHLLTGRMRPFDRDETERGLLDRIAAGRIRSAADKPVVVVATQTIEAGADFDFDAIVTECASLDALRQRFGRLDRLGTLSGTARGVIVAQRASLEADAVYADAIGATWRWLSEVATAGVVDFGIRALPEASPGALVSLLAPRSHAPTLLPAHLDAWTQTSPEPEPDPDIALWLHGPMRGPADVTVVWRADLTEHLLRTAIGDGDERTRTAALDAAVSLVGVLPPVSAESLTVPIAAARRWLAGLDEPEFADVEGATVVEDEGKRVAVGLVRPVLVWRGDDSTVVATGQVGRLSPGQTIVVPATYGGISHGNWDPAATEPVRDVAELASYRQRGRPTLRCHPDILQGLYGPRARAVPAPDETLVERERGRRWIEALSRLVDGASPEVAEMLDALRASRRLRVERVELPDDQAVDILVGVRMPGQAAGSQVAGDDGGSGADTAAAFTGAEVTLAAHAAGVAGRVERTCTQLSLNRQVAADLRLAAIWHDAGKADARFQRWLHGGSEYRAMVQPEPLAKSPTRVRSLRDLRMARERARYPAGARHEILSAALLAAAPDLRSRAGDWDLVLHLVASHHGHARALAPVSDDAVPVSVTWSHDGVTVSGSSRHALDRLDSGVADRFWTVVRRYGWWGTAWLEAVLRLADHQESRHEQEEQSG